MRRVWSEEIAVLLHELLEVRLAAGQAIAEHLVEVFHHLLHARHVFGRHVGDLVVHVLEEGLRHRLLQHLHQFGEFVLRLRIHELVVLQLLHRAANVRWQAREEVLLAVGDVLEHLGELIVLAARAGLLLTAWLLPARLVAARRLRRSSLLGRCLVSSRLPRGLRGGLLRRALLAGR